MNVWQLRLCAERLGVPVAILLHEVDGHERQLKARGGRIVAERKTNPVVALIELAMLAALLSRLGASRLLRRSILPMYVVLGECVRWSICHIPANARLLSTSRTSLGRWLH
jgi:hypothetical protein